MITRQSRSESGSFQRRGLGGDGQRRRAVLVPRLGVGPAAQELGRHRDLVLAGGVVDDEDLARVGIGLFTEVEVVEVVLEEGRVIKQKQLNVNFYIKAIIKN